MNSPNATFEHLRTLRIDQNGSLVAPGWLTDAFTQFAAGKISEDQLREVQDKAIREVVGKQEAIGLPIVSDGEFRRRNFKESFSNAVSGNDVPVGMDRAVARFEPNAPLNRTEQNFQGVGPAVITRRRTLEKLKLVRNVIAEEYRFSSSVAKAPVKVSLIGPDRISQRFSWEESREVYRDIEEFIADVVAKGDEALVEYTSRFDRLGASFSAERLRIGADEVAAAVDSRPLSEDAAPVEEAKAEGHAPAAEEPKAEEPPPAVGQPPAAEAAPAAAADERVAALAEEAAPAEEAKAEELARAAEGPKAEEPTPAVGQPPAAEAAPAAAADERVAAPVEEAACAEEAKAGDHTPDWLGELRVFLGK